MISKFWQLKKLNGSTLIRNTIKATFSLGLRTGITALYFVIITRNLGPVEYGAFAAVLAFVAVLAPYSSWGSGLILIKHTARNKDLFPVYFGSALLTLFVSGSIFTILVLILFPIIVSNDIPFIIILCVALSDLIFVRLQEICAQAYQAYDNISRATQLQILSSLTRLVSCFLLLIFFKNASASDWAFLYLVSSFVPSVISVLLVQRELGKAKLSLRPMRNEFKEGLFFSLGLSSQSITNNIDKSMISSISGLEAAGIYSAAYRIVEVSFTPVLGLLYSTFSDFFKKGKDGIHETFAWAKRLIPWTAFYGLFMSIFVILISESVPLVLGEEYKETAVALRWIAPLIFIMAIQSIAGTTLTGAGYQSFRGTIQLLAAGINVVLNFILITKYGWLGAAWSSLITDGMLAIIYWCAIIVLNSKGLKWKSI